MDACPGTVEHLSLKLPGVISDIHGVSGRDMRWAIIAGERDPKVLAGKARTRMRPKMKMRTCAWPPRPTTVRPGGNWNDSPAARPPTTRSTAAPAGGAARPAPGSAVAVPPVKQAFRDGTLANWQGARSRVALTHGSGDRRGAKRSRSAGKGAGRVPAMMLAEMFIWRPVAACPQLIRLSARVFAPGS
jgi:hypothetical protein